MTTILVVLSLVGGVEVVIDATQMYEMKTLKECQLMLSSIKLDYAANSGYCAIGDILNPIERNI